MFCGIKCRLIMSAFAAVLISTPTPAQQGDTATVRVQKVSVEPIKDTLSLSGEVNSLNRAGLSTEIDGSVSQIHVDVGSRVMKGDALLALDDALARQTLLQAQAAEQEAMAQFGEAERAWREAQTLQQDNHIAKSELLTRESNRQAASAALAGAKAQSAYQQTLVSKHLLQAPFDGVIVARNAEVGEWHSRGSSVLTLVSTRALRIDVYLPQERFSALDQIISITVTPDTHPDQSISADIATVVPVGSDSARTFLVRLHTSEASQLVPGTSVVANMIFESDHKGVVVSRDALLRHADGGYSAFVVENNQAKRRKLTIGNNTAGGVVVLEGLSAGDQVVVRGNEVLQDGQQVNAKPLSSEEQRVGD